VHIVKELLDHGAEIDAKTNHGHTPLQCACLNGHLAIVNELVNPNDSNCETTSILGKRKSRGGADIGAKDDEGDTPLHSASVRDHLPIVKALLVFGADCRASNTYGQLPIDNAVNREHAEVAKCLLQHFYATTRRLPLHKLLEDLTWIGNPNNVPPLHEALYRDMLGTDDVVEIIEFLVDRNPELLSSLDQDGSLPLHVSCRRGAAFSIVQSLVNLYKASVKSVTPQGDLPLFLACEMPETSLGTIFRLMKLYPDLVYR
jgi:ankyrin repeat protein